MLPENLDDAKSIYEQFVKDWEINLKSIGVRKPPKFGTKGSWTYLYAYCHMGKPITGLHIAKWASQLSGEEFTEDSQALRHMSNTYGYNARKRNGIMPDGSKLKSGQYSLINMLEAAPGWKNNRSKVVKIGDWEDIKKHYNYKCACCGSAEGKSNNRMPGTSTILEKGHMNPRLPLGPGNMIPQCQICNKPYLDHVVFDKNGYVHAIASTKLLERADEETQKQCWEMLRQKFGA
jgi:hypothetical protein